MSLVISKGFHLYTIPLSFSDTLFAESVYITKQLPIVMTATLYINYIAVKFASEN